MWFKYFILISFFSLSFGDDVSEDDFIISLTFENFTSVVKESDYIMVEFYAPWCAHCKALAPEYLKAAQLLKSANSNVKLAKVDATVELTLAEMYEIKGYPTLKFFNHFKMIDYLGPREAESIVAWLNKKSGSPVQILTTEDEVANFIDSRNVAVIGFFMNTDSNDYQSYDNVAYAMDEPDFGLVTDPSLFTNQGVIKDSVVLYKKFENKRDDLIADNPFTVEAIRNFVLNNQLPLIVDFNQDSAERIFSSSIKTMLFVLGSKTWNQLPEVLNDLGNLAALYKGKVIFVFVNTDEDNDRVLEFFGLEKSDCPTYRLIENSEETVKYKPEINDFSGQAVASFIQKHLEGQLTPHLMSAVLPEDWNQYPVKVLVGSNFEQVVKDKSKDVFVEFYAPWCEHCKQLAPTWELLGEEYKDHPEIVIAKIDATVNEVHDIKIRSYPTIKYFPKNDGDVIDYEGDRTLESFKKFLESGGREGNIPSTTVGETFEGQEQEKEEL